MTDSSTDSPMNNLVQKPKQRHRDLIDLLQVATANIRLLFFGSLGTGLASLAVVFLIPPTFTAYSGERDRRFR
jgi:hypothetical protein